MLVEVQFQPTEQPHQEVTRLRVELSCTAQDPFASA